MNKLEQAIEYFHQDNFSAAEKISLEILKTSFNSIDAIDILSAIYLKTNNLNFLQNAGKKELDLIRQIARFLHNLKTYEQAVIFYKKALEIEPNDYVAYNNLGLIYETLDDIENAIVAYKNSLQVKENYPALYNIGVIYRKQKSLNKSLEILHKAIKSNPDNPYANYSLAMTYLMQKDFFNGYKYFLNRPMDDCELKNNWTGEKHPQKTVLVYCEYGLGDAIMFSRYFPILKNYFKHVIVCCKHSLINLFVKSFPDIEFVEDYKNIKYDFITFAMLLPYYLNLDFFHIPSAKGYLVVDKKKIDYYKNKYFNNDNKKIGIFYLGGEKEKRNAKYRQIQLNYMEKLFDLSNAKFYSFQIEDCFNELKQYPDIIDLGKTFKDFTDTAAAIKNLDLFITIDSAPVHLAGALGVKTLLMLPYYSEWRWFTEENTTPWYESVELVRQPQANNWQAVIDNIYKKYNY